MCPLVKIQRFERAPAGLEACAGCWRRKRCTVWSRVRLESWQDGDDFRAARGGNNEEPPIVGVLCTNSRGLNPVGHCQMSTPGHSLC